MGSAGPSAELEALLGSERVLERVFIVAGEQKREERELVGLRTSFLIEKNVIIASRASIGMGYIGKPFVASGTIVKDQRYLANK